MVSHLFGTPSFVLKFVQQEPRDTDYRYLRDWDTIY